MADLDITGRVTMDASQAEGAFARVGTQAGQMSNAVAGAAGKASDAVGKIGAGSERGEQTLTRSQSRMRDEILKSTRAIENLGKTASQKLELKISTQGLDPAMYAPYLAKLKEAEAAQAALGQSSTVAGGLLEKMGLSAGNATKLLGGLAAAAAGLGLKEAFSSMLFEQEQVERNLLRTNALLKANGMAAGLNSTQLTENARSLALATLQSTEGIEKAQQILLTFGNVTGSTFLRATEAAANLATVTGSSLTASMTMLGKALNDPVEGLNAMKRAGVSFSEAQKDTIKTLVESNKVLEAQTLILDELAVQYGGVAKAEAMGYAGAIDTLGQRVQELKLETADYLKLSERGGAVVNVFAGAVEGLTKSLRENSGAVTVALGALAGVTAIGSVLAMSAALGGVAGAIKLVTAGFSALTAVMAANPFGLVALGIGAAAGALIAYNRAQADTVPGMKQAIMNLESANNSLLNLKGQAGMSAAERRGYDERIAKIKELRAAVNAISAATPVSSGSVGSGDTALLRAQRAEFDAQAKSVSDFWEKNQTNAQKMDAALKAARASMGELFSPEIERSIRAQYATKTQGAASATEAVKREKVERERLLDLEKDRAKSMADTVKLIESAQQADQKTVASAIAAAVAAEEQLATYGMLESQIQTLTLTRLQDARESAALAGEDVANIEKRIVAQQRLIAATTGREALKAAEQTAKDALAASTKAAKDAATAWQKTADSINDALTESLLRGFESGKDFAQNFKDTLVNLFKTLILRPTISAILAPVAGAFSGNAMAGQGGGDILSTLQSGFSSLNSSVSSTIGNAFSKFATSSSGQSLGLSTTAGEVFPGQGASLTANGQLMSQGLQVVGDTLAGYAIGSMARSLISNGYSAGKGMDNLQKAGIAVASAVFGPVGGAIAGAVSGVVNQVFGRKLKDSGVEGTFGGQEGFTGNSFEFLKGGLLRSDKTNRNPLDEEVRKGLGDAFGAMRVQVGTFAAALGLNTDQIAGFTDTIKLSLKGLSAEDAEKKVQEALAASGEKLAGAVLGDTEFQRAGEDASGTLTRLAASLITVNGVFDTLGETLFDTSLAGADMASSLIDAFGGGDQFASATQTYFANFYSEAERTEIATRQLTTALAGLGLELPTSISAYRELAEAQDLTTDGGRNTYAALLTLSGAFAEVTNAAGEAAVAASAMAADLKQQASIRLGLERDLLELQGDTAALRLLDIAGMDAANIALFDRIALLTDEARVTQERNGLMTSLLQSLGNTGALRAEQLAGLDPSNRALQEQVFQIEDAKAALTKALQAENESAQAAQQAAQERVSAIRSIFDTLKSNVESLRGSVESTRQGTAQQANAFLDNALATARASGYLPDAGDLADAITNARGGLDRQFVSEADRQFQTLVLAGKLSELQDISGDQLTIAERQLRAAEDQVDGLDALQQQGQALLDSLSGNTTATLSIVDAIAQLSAAVLAARSPAVAAAGGGGGSVDAGSALLSNVTDYAEKNGGGDLYYFIPGVNDAAAKLAAAENASRLTGMTPEESLVLSTGRDFAYWQEVENQFYGGMAPRAFARGGMYPGGLALVGEEGPELINFKSPGMVYTAAQTQGLLGGGNTERLERLVEGLTAEVQRLQAIAGDGNRQQRRMADTLENVTEGGNQMRTVAA